MNLEKNREVMIENQLRPNKITNNDVLKIFRNTSKEKFISEDKINICYSDQDICIKDRRGYLKNLHLAKKVNSPELENLEEQKNQLEIEYKQLLENYNFLETENLKLKQEFEEFKSKDEDGKRREQKISEKIDELNQETDSLLDEIEKWQM